MYCLYRKCSHVELIADKVKDLHKKEEFMLLSAIIDSIHEQLNRKKDDFVVNLKSLEKSYNTILEKITVLRNKINDSLDLLERNTTKELDTLLATMRASIQTDIETCTESIKVMTCV
ncbi:hypothetical protein DPMN_042277 [Dreissena polymorpha]|uniref:Uncharacterized protein n=1 Tax=Dreissena polymorpha TaxID=45954 RepID=A0A9D4HWU4_DREPO|nr:hypothetical protein DPMN_042277 [Dreissena polymorpha]